MTQSNNNETTTQFLHFLTETEWHNHKFRSKVRNLFSAKEEEIFTLLHNEQIHYLVGIAENAKEFQFQSIARKFSRNCGKYIESSNLEILIQNSNERSILQIIVGLLLGTYEIDKGQTRTSWLDKTTLILENLDQEKLQIIKNEALALFQSQQLAMDWLNKPANHKTAPIFSRFLKEFSRSNHLNHIVFNREKCKELGLGAYLSVNQASENDAAFTIIEYHHPDAKKTIGLIGKSVLFDTGGISLKPGDNMHYMKSDMGGGTAVLGALSFASKAKLPVNIIAIFPITDNAISANAYLPSDVIKAYNGKTIEVLNTDAEGRLTLADALSYAVKNYTLDHVIDLATLTGSSVRMFGDTCGALFSNNTILQKSLEAAGDSVNERLWNMPLWNIWDREFASDVADYKNISLKPVGDCIIAAKFLEKFIENHSSWAHLDIAGVSFGAVDYAKEKAATGYGVQLLVNFLQNIPKI